MCFESMANKKEPQPSQRRGKRVHACRRCVCSRDSARHQKQRADPPSRKLEKMKAATPYLITPHGHLVKLRLFVYPFTLSCLLTRRGSRPACGPG